MYFKSCGRSLSMGLAITLVACWSLSQSKIGVTATGQKAKAESQDCAQPLLICPSEMLKFAANEGESLRIVEGRAHGFESLSLAYSDTKPGNGAPPHRHKCEEAHVVLEGVVKYTIGDQSFIAKAPFVVRIPAGVVHSFTNIGDRSIHVIGVLPKSSQEEIDPE